MKVGHFEVLSVETSFFALDGGAMFGIVPKSVWETQIPADEKNRIPLCTRSLFIVGNDRKIIVDTGNGDKWNDKYRSIFKIDTKTVNMESSLRKFGYAAEDVTDVFCTHLHFDHAGGNTRIDEAGRVVPTFPNATYWVQKSNWELANAPSEKDRASYLSENWAVLAENGMIQLVEGEEEFIPGLEVIVTNGHTAGQQLPKISHGNHTILFAGDLFPTVAHLRIPWVMAYDNFPVQTLAEKKALLPRMVRENWILFLEHDSRHVAVTVEHDGKNYRPKETITIS